MSNLDFSEKIDEIAKKVISLRGTIATEEATKNAFVMPFISQILGYDVFDPTEVIPEFTMDIFDKKGEKVDYAIMSNSAVSILIETKKCSEELKIVHQDQLARYFHVTDARIAMLTNGIVYQFFTDLDKPNIMDTTPFLELNLLDINQSILPELKRMHKSTFNVSEIISTAGELKYLYQIKKTISSLFAPTPPEDFVRFVLGKMYDGVKTTKVVEQFTTLIQRASEEFITDTITEKFENVMGVTVLQSVPQSSVISLVEDTSEDVTIGDVVDSGIITTDEELESFYIVKSIIRQHISSERITHRDAKSYFAIFIDDNNRKPVCRLHLNRSVKYLEVFNAKDSVKYVIETVDDIYTFAQCLIDTVTKY